MDDQAWSKEAESHTAIVIDPAEERAVLKKIDRVILPLMAFVYFFQCKYPSLHICFQALTNTDLDKQSINYAAAFNLSEDLDLSGSQFSWAISLFYFGQLVSEYPAAYLMSRLRITQFVGICM